MADTYLVNVCGDPRVVTFPQLCDLFADQYDTGEHEAWRLLFGGAGTWQYDVQLVMVVR